ncbi:MAG: nitroreductase family protein [Candidatus Omnitrophica bacterium]|nr:nitroreductase family protein [Candidatus Omnitrophota bacterium]
MERGNDMDLFDAISSRYCYRDGFRDEPVPRAALEKIVKAGLAAPSGKNAQTSEFVIVDDPELLGKIGEMHQIKAMHDAKAMIVCMVDREPPAVYEGHSFQVEDLAAAVMCMLLAITSLGYASVWIDGWLRRDERAERIGALLDVPESKVVRILLPIGVPETEGPRSEKRPFGERAWFNRYGT